jgi:hypothetical protein
MNKAGMATLQQHCLRLPGNIPGRSHLGAFEASVASVETLMSAQSHTTMWSFNKSRYQQREPPDSSTSSAGTLRNPHRGAHRKWTMDPRLIRLGHGHPESHTWLAPDGRQLPLWSQANGSDCERGFIQPNKRERYFTTTCRAAEKPTGQFGLPDAAVPNSQVHCNGWHVVEVQTRRERAV